MHPSRKPENWPVIALWMGAIAFVSIGFLTWIPPLVAPARWLSVVSWVVPLTWLGGIVGAIIAAIRGMKRSWKVSCIALVVAGLSIVSIRYQSKGDDWRPLFRSTESARGALVEDASNRNPARYPFPESLKGLSDDFAYELLENDDGRWIAYSVFTQGIDNAVGFCYSFNGAEPAEHALNNITRYERLDDHWFVVWTT